MLLINLGPALFALWNNLYLFKEEALFGGFGNINYSKEILMLYLYDK